MQLFISFPPFNNGVRVRGRSTYYVHYMLRFGLELIGAIYHDIY